MTKNVKNVVKTVVDQSTGEIIDQTVEKHFVSEVKTDNFFMVFFESMGAFLGLKQPADMRLIACLCKIAQFDTGVVTLSPKVRRELSKEANISLSNMSKSFKRLVESGLLIEDEGDYIINPNVFWKGSMKTRTEILQSEGLTFQIKLVEKG